MGAPSRSERFFASLREGRVCELDRCLKHRAVIEARRFDPASPHGRLMAAYLDDLEGLCICPFRRFSRRA